MDEPPGERAPTPRDDRQTLPVGDWTAYPDRLEVHRDGEVVVLEPRVMGVLLSLGRAPGEVVSKERLLDEVWHDVVVADGAVSLAVHKLRRALGDHSRQPRYIQTVARRGYRLIATAAPRGEGGAKNGDWRDENPSGGAAPKAAGRFSSLRRPPSANGRIDPRARRRRWRGVGLGLAFLAGGLGGVLFGGLLLGDLVFGGHRGGHDGTPPDPPRPLTAFPGTERQPALAPSGSQVVYVARRDGPGETVDLWLQHLEAGAPRRLTDDPAIEEWPAWAPDGARLAYFRRVSPEVGDALEGETPGRDSNHRQRTEGRLELVVHELRSSSVRTLRRFPAAATWGLTWSGDGEALIYSRPHLEGGPVTTHGLTRFDLASGRETAWTTPPAGSGDGYPTASPHGDGAVAFARGGPGQPSRILIQPGDGSPPRPVAEIAATLTGLAWNGLDDRIVFGRQSGRAADLWQVASRGGTPQRLELPQELAAFPSVAGGRLVFEHHRWAAPAIRRQGLDGEGSRPWSPSTAGESEPRHSPDGERVAFVSRRRGGHDLWLAERDGARPQRLSHLQADALGDLAWSPRGDRLAFVARLDQRTDLFRLSLEDHRVERLTDDPASELAPAWSPDGSTLYYSSDQTGRWEVWSLAFHPGGRPRRLTQTGGLAPLPLEDGSGLAFRGGDGRLRFLSFGDGGWPRFAPGPSVDLPSWRRRQLTAGRLFLLDPGPSAALTAVLPPTPPTAAPALGPQDAGTPRAAAESSDVGGGRLAAGPPLAHLEGRLQGSFSVDPAGREVLYTVRGEPQIDLAWQPLVAR